MCEVFGCQIDDLDDSLKPDGDQDVESLKKKILELKLKERKLQKNTPGKEQSLSQVILLIGK